MAKISNEIVYIPNTEIEGLDYFIGTDFSDGKRTVNFRIQDLGSHYNTANGVRNLDYFFYNHISANPRPTDGYFYSNGNEQDPNNITHFIFSKKTMSKINAIQFFDSITAINPFDLIISQKVGINSIYFFRIDSVQKISDYFKLNVSKIFYPENNSLEYTDSFAVFNIKASGISVTKTSDLINDGEDSTSTYVETDDLGSVAFSNDYEDLDNKPTTFPPSSHTHIEADITDLDKYTKVETDNLLGNKLDKVTTSGVERAYIINADGSQATKPTSEFKDIIEVANLAALPATGVVAKIYITIDTNLQYRWTGSAYVQIGGGSETLLQVKGFATDFPVGNLLGTSAPMSNINIASGTADYNRSLISTTETGHQGIVALRSSTNANSGFCFFYGGGIINNGDKHVSFFQFKLPTVTDIKGYVGFHSSTGALEPKNACFLEIVNNTGVFKTRDNLPTTASSSFTLSTNTWYNLMIEFKSTTEVHFKIKLDDGTLVAEFTSTTNLPLFYTSPFTIVVNIFSTVATTARYLMLLDYVEYRPEKPNHLKSF